MEKSSPALRCNTLQYGGVHAITKSAVLSRRKAALHRCVELFSTTQSVDSRWPHYQSKSYDMSRTCFFLGFPGNISEVNGLNVSNVLVGSERGTLFFWKARFVKLKRFEARLSSLRFWTVITESKFKLI